MNTRFDALRSVRARRRSVLAGLLLVGAGLRPATRVLAQDQDESGDEGATALAEVPSTGAARPGPITATATTVSRPKGIAPVELQVDRFGIDAPVEEGKIVDGVMQDPSGPWVITWYKQLSELGQNTNVVMAGHVDYWTTGPAVLYDLFYTGISEGDGIRVIGDDGTTFDYAVEWSRLFDVATELTPEVIQDQIVADTGQESLTLITCGGQFDYNAGEYLQRYVVRANAIDES